MQDDAKTAAIRTFANAMALAECGLLQNMAVSFQTNEDHLPEPPPSAFATAITDILFDNFAALREALGIIDGLAMYNDAKNIVANELHKPAGSSARIIAAIKEDAKRRTPAVRDRRGRGAGSHPDRMLPAGRVLQRHHACDELPLHRLPRARHRGPGQGIPNLPGHSQAARRRVGRGPPPAAEELAAWAEASATLEYLDKRRTRMNYGWLRKNGYYIGTSHVEAAARLLTARRCKQAGMHWRVENAARVCDLLARLRSAPRHAA